MKKVVMFVLVVFVLATVFPSYAANINLKLNGTPSKWAQNDLEQLANYSILEQKAFKTYQEPITRLDFIYLAVKLYESITGEEIVVNPSISFVDTKDIYVLKGATVGITSGIGNGKFGTSVKLTREQLATMMVKVLELTDNNLTSTNYRFTDDLNISSYAKAAIYKAYNHKIINGSNNAVKPKENASIEQALLIFKNIYENFVLYPENHNISSDVKLNSEQIGLLAKSVVKIYVEDNDGNFSMGSGFVFEKGKIGTNFHVIENAKKIEIEFDDGTIYTGEVKVIGYDKNQDMAALLINQNNIPVIELGSSDNLIRGQNIYTIGSPQGLMNTLSSGIISSIRDNNIQITAPISPGSSGGILLNEYGKVIGITSSGIIEGENLGFAIPINLFKEMPKSQNITLQKFVEITNFKPKAVSYVTATSLNTHEALLSWEDNGAKGYYVFEKIDDGEWYQLENASGGFEFYSYDSKGLTIQGYTVNQTVVYAVCSVENEIISDYVYSNEVVIKSNLMSNDECVAYLKNNYSYQVLNGMPVIVRDFKIENHSDGSLGVFAYIDSSSFSNYLDAERSNLNTLAQNALYYSKQFKSALGRNITLNYIYAEYYSFYPSSFVDNYLFDNTVSYSSYNNSWFVFYPLLFVDTESNYYSTWFSMNMYY